MGSRQDLAARINIRSAGCNLHGVLRTLIRSTKSLPKNPKYFNVGQLTASMRETSTCVKKRDFFITLTILDVAVCKRSVRGSQWDGRASLQEVTRLSRNSYRWVSRPQICSSATLQSTDSQHCGASCGLYREYSLSLTDCPSQQHPGEEQKPAE